MEVLLVLAVITGIGSLAMLASGNLFQLIFIGLPSLIVVSWVLTLWARREQHLVVLAPSDEATEAVRANFSRRGWKPVDGPGALNFQARGIGINSRGATPPTMSVHIDPRPDGNSGVGVWTSAWGSQLGVMAMCDRVVSQKLRLAYKLNQTSSRATAYGIAPTGANPAPMSASQATSSEPKATLANPRLPEDDPRQLAHLLLTSVGLSFLVYGPADAVACFRAVSAAAPVFGAAQLTGANYALGVFQGQSGFYWLCFESQFGSAIAVCATPEADVDFSTKEILPAFRNLGAPWHWGLGTVGGNVPAGFAHIVDTARVVDLNTLPGLEHLRLTVPTPLQADLRSAGWQQAGGGLFRFDVPVSADRVLAVFYGPCDEDTFGLMTPIDTDENVPAEVRARSYGRYELAVLGGLAVMCQRYRASGPTLPADTLSTEAQALARYTHQQFAATPTFSATQPTMSSDCDFAGDTEPASFNRSPEPQPSAYPLFTPVTEPAPQPHSQGWAPTAARPSSPPPYTVAPPRHPDPTPQTHAPQGIPPATALSRALAKPWILIAAALAAILVIAMATALTRSSGRPAPTSTANSGSGASPLPANAVSPCTSLPTLQASSTTITANGLTVATQLSPNCTSGDLLTNSSLQLDAVDSSGKDVASGLFDLSSTPIAIGTGGAAVTFTFPVGTYWRTPNSIAGDLHLTASKRGSDQSAVNSMTTSAVTATGPGAPASGDLQAAAQSALVDIAAADRSAIDANLSDRWEPQLSSKRAGLVAEGTTWSAADIVREHLQLRQRFPNARLVWSGDWPVFSDPDWWITVAGVPFGSGEDADGWCASQGFDPDHCFAKILSHTMGPDGTTKER